MPPPCWENSRWKGAEKPDRVLPAGCHKQIGLN